MAMTSQYATALSVAVNQVCNDIEMNRTAVVPPFVRNLLEQVAVESVLFRDAEWLRRHNLQCDDPAQLLQTIPLIRIAAEQVLKDANVTGPMNYISAAAVLGAIHAKWCGIFPFCQ